MIIILSIIFIRKLIATIVKKKLLKTVRWYIHNNTGNNIEQPYTIEDTKNNDLENNLDNVFIKPYRK